MNPNLFVAGVPKAGTTSLFHYLALHPDVFPSSRKEPGFFHPFKIKDMDANLDAYKKFFKYLLPENLEPSSLVQLLSTDYKFAVSFTILVIVLLIRPSGIFRGKVL